MIFYSTQNIAGSIMVHLPTELPGTASLTGIDLTHFCKKPLRNIAKQLWLLRKMPFMVAHTFKVNSPKLLRKKMSQVVVKFTFEKATKNSVRYQEVPQEGQAPIIGSLYVQKWFAGNSKNLTVTLDKVD